MPSQQSSPSSIGSGIDRAVCLGDAVQGGDDPRQVLDRLAGLGWPVVLGNADDFLLEVQADSPEPVTEAQLEKRAWTLAQLDAGHLGQIRSFSPTLTIELDDVFTLLAFHGSPRSYDDLSCCHPETEDEHPPGGSPASTCSRAATRTSQWTRYVVGALFVNPGAVLDQRAFAIVTGTPVEFRTAAWPSAS